MRIFVAIVAIALFAASVIACGSETPDPTNTSVPATPTQAQTRAPDTATPEPAATTAPAETPTSPPEPTDTPVPTAVPTPALVPTNTPEPSPTPAPTDTPMPEPTYTPEPTPTAEPTSTPEPTPTAEPTSTPEPTTEPKPAIATDLAPLGDNLLWVAHFDNRTQSLSVYDPSGTFSPEKALPPGQDVPDPSEIGQLTALVPRQIYLFWVEKKETVELNGQTETFWEGRNDILWK